MQKTHQPSPSSTPAVNTLDAVLPATKCNPRATATAEKVSERIVTPGFSSSPRSSSPRKPDNRRLSSKKPAAIDNLL
jgi:hypothetical protein